MTPFEKRKTLPRGIPLVTISYPSFFVGFAILITIEMALDILGLLPSGAGNWLLLGTVIASVLLAIAAPIGMLFSNGTTTSAEKG